ncbi:MAG TPA: preprotein translocase subunit SecG [Candidatus Moranbacteria bacterium]|nr:preprotein translocase subunit SecG [Candidatus Moranbacteria bacterium]
MSILAIGQLITAVLLITAILLQNRSAGMGTAFGGGVDAGYYTRRGFEKFLTQATIVLAILFAAIAIARVLIG